MIETAQGLLETSPMLALFLAIGMGYALGQVPILGFTFGAGAVLFAGLAIGWFAPKSAPPGLVGTIGLLMFVYGVGVQYGPQFVKGLRGEGLKYNLLALLAVLLGLGTTMLLAGPLGVSLATAGGLFAGAGTSTPTLQAAIAASGSTDPAIGYSVAYPIGVIGPIILMTLMERWLKPQVAPPSPALRTAEVTADARFAGRTMAEVGAALPTSVRVIGIRQDHTNQMHDPQCILREGDGVMLLGPPDAVDEAVSRIGSEEPGRLTRDRGDYDVTRVYVSRPGFIGRTLGAIARPDFPLTISHVRRGDTELVATRDLVLEWGDRLVVIAPAGKAASLRSFFGDSIKGNAELSFVSIGVGMAAGLLLGMIPIPLPGGGSFSLGVAGGPLVMALVLGWLGRTGPIGWRMPVAANIVLRNLGLSIFIGQVALGAGAPFVSTLATQGPAMLLAALMVLLVMVLTVLVLGHLVLRIPFDDLLGVCSGVTGNPAILAAASRLAPTDRPDVGYAMVFPTITIAKVIAVQLLLG
ncbi:MAG: YidE/YbjL duplication [Massilia sp.]|nr:YidE/YbjL duplication [Massilia sp.]